MLHLYYDMETFDIYTGSITVDGWLDVYKERTSNYYETLVSRVISSALYTLQDETNQLLH